MIQDPLTVWNGTYPYDALAAVGITPESTQADVEQASFDLMAAGLMNPATQKAWAELRDVRLRLLADFLQYDVDPASDIGRARDRIRAQLGDPGAPPEVGAALVMPPEIMDELADELTGTGFGPLPESGGFPLWPLIDRLIEFDS